MDVNIDAVRKAVDRLSKLRGRGEVPSPDQLFIAEEQPGEVEKWIAEYLEEFPEYREYIESVRREEREARSKPGNDE